MRERNFQEERLRSQGAPPDVAKRQNEEWTQVDFQEAAPSHGGSQAVFLWAAWLIILMKVVCLCLRPNEDGRRYLLQGDSAPAGCCLLGTRVFT